MRKRRSWLRSTSIMISCFLGLFLLGNCGRKAPPEPPRRQELPKVKDLDAEIFEKGVQLRWSIPISAEGVNSFELYRSTLESAEEVCPACPRSYELVRTVKVKTGQTHFQVVDRNIQAEGRFYYRVVPLDQRSRRGPDSNEADVIVKWRRDTKN